MTAATAAPLAPPPGRPDDVIDGPGGPGQVRCCLAGTLTVFISHAQAPRFCFDDLAAPFSVPPEPPLFGAMRPPSQRPDSRRRLFAFQWVCCGGEERRPPGLRTGWLSCLMPGGRCSCRAGVDAKPRHAAGAGAGAEAPVRFLPYRAGSLRFFQAGAPEELFLPGRGEWAGRSEKRLAPIPAVSG